jgi:hypothetical protein
MPWKGFPVKGRAASLAVALLLGLTACTSAPASPSLQPDASGLEGLLELPLVRIKVGVAIASDNRTVTITFIGGPDRPKTDPCYSEYAGWAGLDGRQHLDLAVAAVIDGRANHGTACPAAGSERVVQVVLNKPFVGTTATDLSDGLELEIARQGSG